MTPPPTSRSSSMYHQPMLEQPSTRSNNRFPRKTESYSVYPRPTAYASRVEESQIDTQTWPLVEMIPTIPSIPFTRLTYVSDPMTPEESRVTQWHWMPKAEILPYQQVARSDWNL